MSKDTLKLKPNQTKTESQPAISQSVSATHPVDKSAGQSPEVTQQIKGIFQCLPPTNKTCTVSDMKTLIYMTNSFS